MIYDGFEMGMDMRWRERTLRYGQEEKLAVERNIENVLQIKDKFMTEWWQAICESGRREWETTGEL